jgi:hypothetical protein
MQISFGMLKDSPHLSAVLCTASLNVEIKELTSYSRKAKRGKFSVPTQRNENKILWIADCDIETIH